MGGWRSSIQPPTPPMLQPMSPPLQSAPPAQSTSPPHRRAASKVHAPATCRHSLRHHRYSFCCRHIPTIALLLPPPPTYSLHRHRRYSLRYRACAAPSADRWNRNSLTLTIASIAGRQQRKQIQPSQRCAHIQHNSYLEAHLITTMFVFCEDAQFSTSNSTKPSHLLQYAGQTPLPGGQFALYQSFLWKWKE